MDIGLASTRCWLPLETSVSAQLLWECWLRLLWCFPSRKGLTEMALIICWFFSSEVSQLPCQRSCLSPWLSALTVCLSKEPSPRGWQPLKKWLAWMFSAVTRPELSLLTSSLWTRTWLRWTTNVIMNPCICTKSFKFYVN